MSAEGGKGDPEAARLLARVLDKLDLVLYKHGLEFRDDRDWANFAEEVREIVHTYYDDVTGGDSSYDPNAAPDSTETTETDVDGSETLDSSGGSDSPVAKKRRANVDAGHAAPTARE